MLGAGLQFSRSRNGDDRFYSAARARRSRNQSNPSHREHLKRAQSDVTGSHQFPVLPPLRGAAAEDEAEAKASAALVQLPEPVQLPMSNLERFLESVVLSVPAQFPSQTTMRRWRISAPEFRPYFVLGDLWESFKEWSAYGVGVPLILNESDSAVQYYVPYLSGIQLYGDSKSLDKPRKLGDDSDSDSFRDTSSDGSSDSENYMSGLNPLHEQKMARENAFGKNQVFLRDYHMPSPEAFSSDESELDSSQSLLLFEYFERDQPYGREPLADKISQLARYFPALKTLRSCDLLPSSWISVAWYPIYRIPTGHTLKDLDACFLTFHCLHTPLTGTQSALFSQLTHPSEMSGTPDITLPVFGLACYKFKASLWIPSGGHARQFFSDLLQAAETWITELRVNHPDFLFFCRR